MSIEVKNGRVRYSPDDPQLATLRAMLGASRFTAHGGWVYFHTSPFDLEPWAAWDDVPPAPKALPADFLAIFGPRPVVPLSAVQTWDQELSLWRDGSRPDWVDDGLAFQAQKNFEFYALHLGSVRGTFRLLPYRLTNRAERVFFPDADARASNSDMPAGFLLDAFIVYRYPGYGIADYQTGLIRAGVEVPPDRLVGMLRYGNIPTHSG